MGKSGLVSCICPTGNRRLFLARALYYWHRQDFAGELELVIVDGGAEKFAASPHGIDAIDRYTSPGRTIRYFECPAGMTVGERRNFAVEQAHGEAILHFDDDDWYPRDRVTRQLAALSEHPDAVTGSNGMWAYDFIRRRGWRAFGGVAWSGFGGATLGYMRPTWERAPFPAIQRGEDSAFCKAHAHKIPIAEDLGIYIRHLRNCTGQLEPRRDPAQTAQVRQALGEDLDWYDRLSELFPPPALDYRSHLPKPQTAMQYRY